MICPFSIQSFLLYVEGWHSALRRCRVDLTSGNMSSGEETSTPISEQPATLFGQPYAYVLIKHYASLDFSHTNGLGSCANGTELALVTLCRLILVSLL